MTALFIILCIILPVVAFYLGWRKGYTDAIYDIDQHMTDKEREAIFRRMDVI